MADQCIVCLDNLDVQLTPAPHLLPADQGLPSSLLSVGAGEELAPPPPAGPAAVHHDPNALANNSAHNSDDNIAEIQPCAHVLHDSCLREWTEKANSCPICRQTFYQVDVYNKVGGTKLSSYAVEDKKQIAEFDAQAWMNENPEEDDEPAQPCPICSRSDHEDLLLLCDSCDASYHTYCVGLDGIPRGHWFCLECSEDAAELLAAELTDPSAEGYGLAGSSDGRSDYLPRTQATVRRARNVERSDQWSGAWGQFSRRVFNTLDIDLDNHDDDEILHNFRRSQQRREMEHQEWRRWQQRLTIASRLGAREVFANSIPSARPRPAQQAPPTPQESADEKRAWGALDRAMEASTASGATSGQKRRARSISAAPAEPPQEPERKLKRPRTRRVQHQSEPSSSTAAQDRQSGAASSSASTAPAAPPAPAAQPSHGGAQPSFLSSLLKEVESSPPSDDETMRLFLPSRPGADASSPASSPSPSNYSSPRALSTTPPPLNIDRPGSPLSLMSRIEPMYPPANFSPNRNGGDNSDSESSKPRRQQQQLNGGPTLEIRHPRPRRQQPVDINADHMSRSPDSSPTRGTLPLEMKESISKMITSALKPHYKSGNITADEYTTINRELSRKLYGEITEEALEGDSRKRYETLAGEEVARAVADFRNAQV